MSDTPGGSNWWQASDGKWYPPESHPAYVPLPPPPGAGGPLPAPTQAPGGSPIVQPPTTPWWRRWWVIAIAVFLVIGIVVAVAAGGGDDDSDSSVKVTDEPADVEESSEDTVAEDPSTTEVDEVAETVPEEELVETSPPSTAAPSTVGLTLDSPAPVGEVVDVGDWAIRVTALTPDAADAVAAENQFNDPPAPGKQFFMATLEATYTGSESSTFWIDTSLKAVGPQAVAYESFEAGCGVLPNDIDRVGEAFPGGTITGNVCWSVDVADADAMVMIAESGFSFDDDDRRFLSMDPLAEVLDGSTTANAPTPQAIQGVSIGESLEIGDWSVKVVSVNPDAAAAIAAENQFNDPPAAGKQFFMATLEATYTGSESSTFWVDTSLDAVGPRAVAYGRFESTCGVLPNDLDSAGETFPGGTISGNVCWSVDIGDAAALTMLAGASFDFGDDRQAFSLTN